MLNKGLFTSNSEEWATPRKLFDELNAEFGFTLDPCATPENAKCERYFTKEQDGLSQPWGGQYFVTLRMVGKCLSGLRKHTGNVRTVQLSYC